MDGALVKENRGQVGFFFLLFIIGALAGLYFGYDLYIEKYYFTFYDGEMTRFLEIPSYVARETPGNLELVGQCALRTSVVPEQVAFVLESACKKRGYPFKQDKNDFVIEVSPTYKVRGRFLEGKLLLSWKPVLLPKLEKKAGKITPLDWIIQAFEPPKKKK